MWTNAHSILLITLAGYALRLPLLDRFPFREDEAIYSYWALHGWRQDPFFLTVWPDKPPLFLWLLGSAYAVFGIEPASARWLNIAAGTLIIPIIAVTARRLWGDRAGLIAALVMALSPFAISFSPTAFVDPVLVLAGSCALWAAVSARPMAAGFWLGAAIMTKQQGLLYVPLILGMLALRNFAAVEEQRSQPTGRENDESPRTRKETKKHEEQGGQNAFVFLRLLRGPLYLQDRLRELLFFLSGLALSTLPIVWWDSRRWAVAPSPWDLGVRNYAPLALLPPEQWSERIQAWWPIAWQITASSTAWTLFGLAMLAAIAVAGVKGLVERRLRERPDTQSLLPALILMLWMSAYLFLHIATNVQIWDRYLLPLAPLVALLAGWAATVLPLPKIISMRRAMIVALVFVLAIPSWRAATGALPIGSDHGAYSGLDESLAWIRDQAIAQTGTEPRQSILYHNTLGWHHQFYLYQEIERGYFTLRWFPTSTYLVDNAEKRPDLRKFYVQADWAPQPDLVRRLDMRSIALINRFESGNFTVYELTSQDVAFCTWCVCTQKDDPPGDAFGWKELELDGIRRSTMLATSTGDELR